MHKGALSARVKSENEAEGLSTEKRERLRSLGYIPLPSAERSVGAERDGRRTWLVPPAFLLSGETQANQHLHEAALWSAWLHRCHPLVVGKLAIMPYNLTKVL